MIMCLPNGTNGMLIVYVYPHIYLYVHPPIYVYALLSACESKAITCELYIFWKDASPISGSLQLLHLVSCESI